MKVFLSWSGERSKKIATELREWIPKVLHNVETWTSKDDIDPGDRWSEKLAEELNDTSFGIICLTPENCSAPWLIFEAGALSKSLESARVVPYLFEIKPPELSGPLAQFQAAFADKEGTEKLIRELNEKLDEKQRLTEKDLDEAFNIWWPNFDKKMLQVKEMEVREISHRTLPPEFGEALKQLAELSSHPITIVFSKKIKEKAPDATIRAVSPKANEFYGFPPGSGKLVNMGLGDLLNILRNWMDEDDFKEFSKDQARIGQAFAEGRALYAKTPIKMNKEHPDSSLHEKVFWPIIVGRTREMLISNEESQEYLTIMYLDVGSLPEIKL